MPLPEREAHPDLDGSPWKPRNDSGTQQGAEHRRNDHPDERRDIDLDRCDENERLHHRRQRMAGIQGAGICSSGMRWRNLKIAVVVAKDPMPSVSKSW